MKYLFLSVLFLGLNGSVFASRMQISVTYDLARPGDSLFLEYYTTFFPSAIKPKVVSAARSEQGTYNFDVQVDGPVRFSILKRLDQSINPYLKGVSFSFDTMLYQYYWHGDGQLTIHISKRPGSAPQNNQPTFDFSYNFQGYRAAQHRVKALSDSAFALTGSTDAERANYLEPQCQRIQAGIAVLDSQKSVLTDPEYQQLKAEIIYQHPTTKLRGLKEKMVEMTPEKKDDALRKIDNYFDWGFDQEILANSWSYIYYWFERQKMSVVPVGKKFDADVLLDTLLSAPTSLLNDRRITYTLALGRVKNHAYYLPQVLSKIRDKDCRQVVHSMDVRAKGKPMFDFELPDTTGKLVKLSDFKGKTVLIDLWYTGCGGCEQYYSKVLSKVEKQLHGKGIEFIAISMDRGRERWKKSIRSNQYTSELATNLYTAGAGFKHEISSLYGIAVFPTLIIVDKDGRIADFDSQDLHLLDSASLISILSKVSAR